MLHKLLSDRPPMIGKMPGNILRQGEKLNLEYVDAWLKKIDRLSPGWNLIKEFKELIKE